MNRHADGSPLVGNGSSYSLADPPCSIGGELVPSAVVELVHGPDEADIALLDEIQERHAAPYVLFGNAHHQPRVGLDQVLLCRLAIPDNRRKVRTLLVAQIPIVAKLPFAEPAGLHPLGQRHLLLRRQQRNATDLFEIEADRIVDVDCCEIDIASFDGAFNRLPFPTLLLLPYRFFQFSVADLDPHLDKRSQSVLQLFDMQLGFRDCFHYIIICDIALVTPERYQAFDRARFVLPICLGIVCHFCRQIHIGHSDQSLPPTGTHPPSRASSLSPITVFCTNWPN